MIERNYEANIALVTEQAILDVQKIEGTLEETLSEDGSLNSSLVGVIVDYYKDKGSNIYLSGGEEEDYAQALDEGINEALFDVPLGKYYTFVDSVVEENERIYVSTRLKEDLILLYEMEIGEDFDARENLVTEIKSRGFSKVLLVSDKSLAEAGVTVKVESTLK